MADLQKREAPPKAPENPALRGEVTKLSVELKDIIEKHHKVVNFNAKVFTEFDGRINELAKSIEMKEKTAQK